MYLREARATSHGAKAKYLEMKKARGYGNRDKVGTTVTAQKERGHEGCYRGGDHGAPLQTPADPGKTVDPGWTTKQSSLPGW